MIVHFMEGKEGAAGMARRRGDPVPRRVLPAGVSWSCASARSRSPDDPRQLELASQEVRCPDGGADDHGAARARPGGRVRRAVRRLGRLPGGALPPAQRLLDGRASAPRMPCRQSTDWITAAGMRQGAVHMKKLIAVAGIVAVTASAALAGTASADAPTARSTTTRWLRPGRGERERQPAEPERQRRDQGHRRLRLGRPPRHRRAYTAPAAGTCDQSHDRAPMVEPRAPARRDSSATSSPGDRAPEQGTRSKPECRRGRSTRRGKPVGSTVPACRPAYQ